MKTGYSNQFVTIKGTKEGLIVHLDDRCAYSELMNELSAKMMENMNGNESNKEVHVRVHVGKRYVDDGQREEIRSTIEQSGAIVVSEIVSDVITMAEAMKIKEDNQIQSYSHLVRSGQVLRVKGDALILGDVNPGGTVEATGDVYVLGALKGTARAGTEGNEEAVVAAAMLAPSQMMIADHLYLTELTREELAKEATWAWPRYAYVKKEQQTIEFYPMSSLAELRKQGNKDKE
ncbi:septum site-determining protein MinC [Salicibibacter cibi]|uniref:Probable septum site-determining protein MinC n=1 Tax=Salicibibacter cibi TaxID=2743001 RepID=A0A7T6ZCQ9_9BACI|nr:septum site-determining protein MinC [Salicibibacter cibi]QQK80937.1 septum site-determining protein MinC [Salicibibacter cibi]